MSRIYIAITFTTDGTGHALYTEAIELASIGRLAVQRATTIEYDNNTLYWRVRNLNGSALFNSASRQKCLDWERQHLESEEDRKHELSVGAGAVAVSA
ncbi:MAG: hypothetical protein WCL16_04205 [bacterium]